MLNSEQIQTIDRRVLAHREQHIAALHAVTNEVLSALTPGHKQKYAQYFEILITGTLKAISVVEVRLVEDVLPALLIMKRDITEENREQVLAICDRHFDGDLYRKRITSFKESFSRRMGGYGMAVDLQSYRFDLFEARYIAGTANARRKALGTLKSALDVRVYADPSKQITEIPASFAEQANEVVELKPNLFGLGINLNKLVEMFLRRKRKKHNKPMQATREDARA